MVAPDVDRSLHHLRYCFRSDVTPANPRAFEVVDDEPVTPCHAVNVEV